MAVRDFDAEFGYEGKDGHEFTLGGYTFHTPPVVPPAAFMGGGYGLGGLVKFLRQAVVAEDRANLERVLGQPDLTARQVELAPEVFAAVQGLLGAEDSGDKKLRDTFLADLRTLVEKAGEPDDHEPVLVSVAQVDAVVDWVMEATTGRDPKSPASSSNGGGRTSNGSKATSSKQARAGRN